jgi:hypothetical protein
LSDQIDIERVESGLEAHAGAGDGGLATRVSGADYDDVELFRKLHDLSILTEAYLCA